SRPIVPARVVGQSADHREEAGLGRLRPIMTRALFVNSGMLGHRAFAGLMSGITSLVPGLQARHIDLSRDLTLGDRLIRRLFSVRLTPRTGPAANLDLRRWREE